MSGGATIKAIIVDDESHCRLVLKKQLEYACPQVEVIASTGDPVKAIEIITELQPDVIFLDIEMPVINGFEMLQRIEDVRFDVIFTTAYDEHALKAFQVHAIAYLLKPIVEEELIAAVGQISERRSRPLDQQTIMHLFESMQNSGKSRKVGIPTQEGLEFIDRDLIIRCQSSGNYTRIIIDNRTDLLVSKTLKIIEELIADPVVFIRTHAAHLVNLNYVAKYLKGSGGQLVMTDGSIIPVSKSRKDSVIQCL